MSGREGQPRVGLVIGALLLVMLSRIDATWVRDQVALLDRRGLVDDHWLTDSGHTTAERLIQTSRMALRALVADWSPDGQDARLNDAIARIAEELTRETPAAR